MLKNHDLVDVTEFRGVRYELRAARTPKGDEAKGIHNAWIWLDNPSQFNSYTTDMVKAVILGFRKASNDRSVNAIVFTAVGDKAFCTTPATLASTSSTCACSTTW
jgi:6-oxo-cyclohex-1-ene-carbonyl-CoA hydrolase